MSSIKTPESLKKKKVKNNHKLWILSEEADFFFVPFTVDVYRLGNFSRKLAETLNVLPRIPQKRQTI